jgi:predicted GIY-YIG superfamily endonuclease
MRGVYTLHSSVGLGSREIRHYTGYACDIDKRVAQHRAGQGAKITREMVRQGGKLTLAHVREGATPSDERRIKRLKRSASLVCSICT